MGLKKNCSWIRIERHFPSLCFRYRHCHNSITLLERRHENGGRWLLTRPTPGPGIRCWQQDFGTLRASCSNENWGEMNKMDEAEIAVPMKLLKNARNRCTQTLRFYLSWVALSPFWWERSQGASPSAFANLLAPELIAAGEPRGQWWAPEVRGFSPRKMDQNGNQTWVNPIINH